MAINTVFEFIIVTSFIALGQTQANTVYKNFTLSEFARVWYDIGRTPPFLNDDLFSCGRNEIIARDYNNQTFDQIQYTLKNGTEVLTSTGHGKIIDGQAHVNFNTTHSPEFVFAVVAKFNNGMNIIIREMNFGFYALLSQRNTSSPRSKAALEHLGRGDGVAYFNQNNCQNMPK